MRLQTTLLATALVVLASLALPGATHAQTIPFFGPIVPESAAACPAAWGLLIVVINRIIIVLISVAIVFVAPLMIAWAGFLLVANPFNSGAKDQAKKILTNTVVGIVVAMCGWLIVDAVMAVVYQPTSGAQYGSAWGRWYDLISSGGSGNYCIPVRGAPGGTYTPPPTITVAPPPATDEQTIRNQLAAANITINNAPCPAGSNGQGCTNVAGMKQSTVLQVIAIKNKCGASCTVRVTGGTEPGHASGVYSHGSGYKVDLGLDTTLNTFLRTLPLTGQRGGDNSGPIRQDTCKNQYVQESNHWDIKILQTCNL